MVATRLNKPAKTRPGPWSKLTPERQDKLLEALRAGASRGGAADYARIGLTTFYDWMKQGKLQPETEFGEFRRLVLEAESVAELSAVVAVRKDDPKWFLSRRFNRRWSDEQKQTITHLGPNGGPIGGLSTEDLIRLIDRLKEGGS